MRTEKVRAVFFDQSYGFHAVAPLPNDINFRERLQEKHQLIARRFFVVHNDGVDGHIDH